VAKNALAILRKQRVSLDRAIRALEQLQELGLAVPQDSKDAANGQSGAKVLPLYKLDREGLERPLPFRPSNDPGND
jgi:hypothetical protein